MTTERLQVIRHFDYDYAFLSNFYNAEVELDGVMYRTTEHAYQAAKVEDKSYRQKIRSAPTAKQAKRLGQKEAMAKHGVELRKDWEKVKINVMLDLLRKKFQHPELRQKLLDTADAQLVEGNYWSDFFWGVCNGRGENWLGRLLMSVRKELRE